MSLEQVVGLAALVFPLSEIALAVLKRARPKVATVDDHGSMRLIWLVVVSAVALAFALRGIAPFKLPGSAMFRATTALAFLAGGLGLRWYAILTLGSFFTTDIAIHAEHAVIETGPYRFIRHPSYTGLLLAFAGLGVYFGNWLSLAVIVLPVTLALMHRIRLEERALAAALGAPYLAYCARTRRLVPGLI